jgi:hypothetical protein
MGLGLREACTEQCKSKALPNDGTELQNVAVNAARLRHRAAQSASACK